MTAAAAQEKSTRILIVDDHPVVRRGLRQLLEHSGDAAVTEADGFDAAMGAVASEPPDVVVVDISLAGRSGMDLIKELRKAGHDVPILVFSMHDERLYAGRVLHAGAQGYVMKGAAPEDVLRAIAEVAGGKMWLSDPMTQKLLRQASAGAVEPGSGLDQLTDRELEVFELIGSGLGTRAVAEKLDVSVKTVETHRHHIKEKLGLADSNALVHFAIRWTS